MKIFFIGDIIGKPGRRAVAALLPGLIERYGIHFVIANCENAAAGFGVTKDVVDELFTSRIDVLTSGNHIWDKKEIENFIDDYDTLIRPANYPENVPGKGSVVYPTSSVADLGVINLMGRVFMRPVECPFRTADRVIDQLNEKTRVIIVDMHAEATSEKKALGWYLDGRVSAVLGTHTHVQTADECILPGGTAYITDVGMTGPFDSVIGIKKDAILKRFLTQVPNRYEVAKNDVWMQGVVIEIDEHSGKSLNIERINLKMQN
ncbi:MAG: TIGR00282 family metallophosphoesterase [Deltaproteobacteria bacterium]|nr:TIGR00282 family metallophosphoesterase [Deltaproteobacteria bacterium]